MRNPDYPIVLFSWPRIQYRNYELLIFSSLSCSHPGKRKQIILLTSFRWLTYI